MNKATNSIDFGEIPDHVGYHIRRAYSHFFRVFSGYGKRFDIRSQQATILNLAQRNPGILPAAIADANGMERSLVTKLTDELEERGFIVRQRSDTDRRNKGLNLTDDGSKFLFKVMQVFQNEMEPELTRNLTAAERNTLIRLLQKIYQN